MGEQKLINIKRICSLVVKYIYIYYLKGVCPKVKFGFSLLVKRWKTRCLNTENHNAIIQA